MTAMLFHRSAPAVLLVSATALAGCATSSAKPPVITYDDPPAEIRATLAPEPPRPVEVVTIPEPLPLPGQLRLQVFDRCLQCRRTALLLPQGTISVLLRAFPLLQQSPCLFRRQRVLLFRLAQ